MDDGMQNEMARSLLNNITLTDNMRVHCDQSMYGRPQLGSCINAANLIGLDKTAKAFRQRHDSVRADVELPVTYISGQRPGTLHDTNVAAL